jgi:hypothetical protein
MRGRLKYGVPIAAGLATGGYALSQGEDPGSAALAAGAGALGGAAGLLGARALAGKYAQVVPDLIEKGLNKSVGKSGLSARERINQAIVNSPEYMRRGQSATLYSPKTIGNIARTGLLAAPANIAAAAKPAFAAAAVPASALAAGLGGVALGAIPGAMGVPGFQQGGAIDPELPGSSNTASAKYGVTPYATTMQYA